MEITEELWEEFGFIRYDVPNGISRKLEYLQIFESTSSKRPPYSVKDVLAKMRQYYREDGYNVFKNKLRGILKDYK